MTSSALESSHYCIGNLLSATGKPAEALDAYQAALEIQREFTTDQSERIDAWSALGATLNNIATIDMDARRFVEARERLREAIVVQHKALSVVPANPTFRAFLGNHLNNLLKADRALGLVEEARERADPARYRSAAVHVDLIRPDIQLERGEGQLADRGQRLAGREEPAVRRVHLADVVIALLDGEIVCTRRGHFRLVDREPAELSPLGQ
jgi:tetratricopeptide (TPR) repeat protein